MTQRCITARDTYAVDVARAPDCSCHDNARTWPCRGRARRATGSRASRKCTRSTRGTEFLGDAWRTGGRDENKRRRNTRQPVAPGREDSTRQIRSERIYYYLGSTRTNVTRLLSSPPDPRDTATSASTRIGPSGPAGDNYNRNAIRIGSTRRRADREIARCAIALVTFDVGERTYANETCRTCSVLLKIDDKRPPIAAWPHMQAARATIPDWRTLPRSILAREFRSKSRRRSGFPNNPHVLPTNQIFCRDEATSGKIIYSFCNLAILNYDIFALQFLNTEI